MTSQRVRTQLRPRAPRTPNPATERQLSYVRSLLNRREVPADYASTALLLVEVTERAAQGKVRRDDPAPLDSTKTSAMIDYLKTKPVKPGTPQSTGERVTREGVFEFDGSIFIVKTGRQSGRLYAQVLTQPDGNTEIATWGENASAAGFVFSRGAMGRLRESHRVSVERAEELSRWLTFCVRCGKHLTAPDSIDAGMGPVCRTKV